MDSVIQAYGSDKLQLRAVYIASSETKLLEPSLLALIEQPLEAQYRIGEKGKLQLSEERGHRLASYTLPVEARFTQAVETEHENAELEEQVVATIRAEFVADYIQVVDDQELSEAFLQDFGRVEVVFHVWPYWREFFQSCCTRMYLPPVLIPMPSVKQSAEPSD